LDTELEKAADWIRENPTKANRTISLRKFLVDWLARCQSGGGTRVCVGAANPPPQAKRRYWRDQFAKNMTDEEFRLAKAAPPEVKSLAAALEVR
jgi:hypothetical protein